MNMFENMDFSKMGEMLQQAQQNAQKMQEEAKNKTFTAKSGAGLVKVSINGMSEVVDVEIDDELLSDKESLQILLISAINDALAMLEDDKKAFASNLLGSLGGFER